MFLFVFVPGGSLADDPDQEYYLYIGTMVPTPPPDNGDSILFMRILFGLY